MEKGPANFLNHATFLVHHVSYCQEPWAVWTTGIPGAEGDAAQLPESQRLCDELGMAPFQEGFGNGFYAGGRTQAWLFGNVTPMMVPPFGRVLLPERKMTRQCQDFPPL